MRVLIADAFCSANRGDAAILDGILSGLRARMPGVDLAVTTHFPAVARHFHDVEAIDARDPLAVQRAVDAAALVVGCGGSYLHDLYALNLQPRLALLHACARADRPYAVFAQSIGPLDSPLSRTGARNALSEATWICVRDAASARVVRELGVRAPITVGVDAAVGGRVAPQPRARAVDGAPTLGVTVRGWHFPHRPGARSVEDPVAAQDRYERDVAAACDAWAAATGGRVRFLSNCTSFGGYVQDDRLAARRVAARMSGPSEVVDDEALSFDVVRGQAAACDLLLGTRMHSLIFATTAGVPAVGIAYEGKTGEWLAQVGLDTLWLPIEDTTGLTEHLRGAWEARDAHAAAIRARLPELETRAAAQLDTLAELVEAGARGGRAAARNVAEAAGEREALNPTRIAADWNGRTWRYDRPHRRLRVVVDTVLGQAGGGRVLDLGGSSGLLGRMLGPRFDYTGIDAAPSVATEDTGFRVVTAGLDDDWPVEGPFDVITASGALEYSTDIPWILDRARALLRPEGVAVFTLFNLAHTSRAPGSPTRPGWQFDMRPDELAVLLREVGLRPARIFASSAGRAPAPAVEVEPHDDPTATMLPLPTLMRLGHHIVYVCRPDAPRPRPPDDAPLADRLRAALAVTREFAWSAHAWARLAEVWEEAGNAQVAEQCAQKALSLDPHVR